LPAYAAKSGDRVRAGPRDYFRCFLPDLTGSVTPGRPHPVTGYLLFTGQMREELAKSKKIFLPEKGGLRQEHDGQDLHPFACVVKIVIASRSQSKPALGHFFVLLLWSRKVQIRN
jgi:hypothetical protein